MAMVAEDIVVYPSTAHLLAASRLSMGGWNMANGTGSKRKQAQPQQCKPEPSIFTCGTCKSVYSSSWFLVQHVQKTHGLKIYEEPRDSSPPPPPAPPAPSNNQLPARPIVVQPDKVLGDQLRGEKDSSPSSPFHAGSKRPRSPTHSPSRGAGGDMFPFPTPFMPGAPRQPANSPAWPYGRSPMGADFAAMIQPELMMDQLRRLQQSMAEHPAALAAAGIPFLRPPALDTTQYSHSDRLRLLAASGAAGGTSPKHIPTSNSRKTAADLLVSPTSNTQPTASSQPSAFTTPTSSSSSNHDTSPAPISGSRQLKQCEFCQKQFRFTSNLVLHRRMHTGETPYRCPLCSFASAQATKLRTHMRSHVTSPGAALSPHDAKLTDSDIEDTEEFVQREAEAEAAIRQLERDAKKQQQDDVTPTDLSRPKSNASTTSPAPNASAEEEDVVSDRTSLLTEVMMKTGLSSLPNYKEAFTAALAEVPGSHKSPSPKPDGESDKPEAGEIVHSPVKVEPVEVAPDEKDGSVHEMTDGDVEEENDESLKDDESRSSHQRRSPQSHASSEYSATEQPPEKRIKRESSPTSSNSPSSFPNAATDTVLFQRAAMEAAQQGLYPGILFPPISSASALPFNPFMHRGAGAELPILSAGSRLAAAAAASSGENGVSSKESSAFNYTTGSPKLPSPDPNGLATGQPPSGIKRRNDTCEFCGKVFKNCSNLTVHRRSHTGEKPYKCQLCPYACAQSSKLTRHMRTHGRHGKDVYRCKFCCMPFSVPSTLEKHMRKCVENQQRAVAAARHLASPHAAASPLTSPTV